MRVERWMLPGLRLLARLRPRGEITVDTTDVATNLFLQGNFAPVHDEVTADELPVIGELPRELDGVFVRNGPNPQFPPLGRYHWFDGDGMLHGVRLREGKAAYRNRYVRTAGWQKEREAGRALWTGLLEPPRMDNGDAPFKNTANTAVVWHDGRLLALWEGGEPHEVRLPGLETVGPYTYGGRLVHAFTAHPKVDAVTGEMLFFGYDVVAPPYLQYSIASQSGEIVHTTPIELPIGVMMHDFAVTERYTIFMNLPYTFDLMRMMKGGPLAAWQPERGAHFGILPRHAEGSRVRWFSGPACYVFHTLNAFEDGEEVVLDGCRHPSMDLSVMDQRGDGTTEATGNVDQNPRLHRWRFNLATGVMREEPLDDVTTEYPRVNDALVGRAARYGYAASFGAAGFEAHGLLKYDLARGRSEAHRHGDGRFGGEGVFVPRPGATAEDDGWLMTFVYDRAADASELIVVNTQDFAAPPVARVQLPQRVPYGFHGSWIPADAIADQRP